MTDRECLNPRHRHGPGYPLRLCRMGRSAPTPAASRAVRVLCALRRIAWGIR